MVPYMAPLLVRPTSGHCTSAGNQPQIKSGGVLESSALALHDCTVGQIPISHPCERVPLEKRVSNGIFAPQVSPFIAIWLTMQHMAIWHSRGSKSRQWHQGVFHSHAK